MVLKKESSKTANLGENIRVLRRRLGVNQGELADLAGVNRSYLSMVENGHSSPTIEVMQKLAKGLNVTVIDIISVDLVSPSTESSVQGKQTGVSYDEETRTEYFTDDEFEMYPGLKDFLEDEDEILLAQPSEEEIGHLKGIRFGRNYQPDKRFYRIALLDYRRRKKSSSSNP
ncbi:MAG: helix-turn-helix transcriptional regulator [Candidatus Hatepunaea meridiana]|nr:helix-turn-helix transcriptional regulator [Candidatus Hatepunaea meridiana]